MRKNSIIMVCVLSLILGGCSLETKKHIYTYTKKDGFSYITKAWYHKILPALNDGKTDVVCGYFCKKVKGERTKKETEKISSLLKNNIDEYGKGELQLKYISSDDDQTTVEKYSYIIDNIYLKTGEKYILEIDFFETNTIKPDLVGMTCIQLYDVTESKDVYPLDSKIYSRSRLR